jgi:hypothetical protein
MKREGKRLAGHRNPETSGSGGFGSEVDLTSVRPGQTDAMLASVGPLETATHL